MSEPTGMGTPLFLVRDPVVTVFGLTAIAALFSPLGPGAGWWSLSPLAACLWLAAIALFGVAFYLSLSGYRAGEQSYLYLASALGGGISLLLLLQAGVRGANAVGLWIGLFALGVLVWRLMERLATAGDDYKRSRAGMVYSAAAPVAFGVWLVFLWQVVVTGFSIPSVLLPAPSAIWEAILTAHGTLGADFVQTYIRAVTPGWVIGCGAGLLTGIAIDRVPFLQRGLLPIGNLVSALPIVAVAPIMVMWFGFDWQSKAAVVVIMTFFPMLVNTIAGLHALGRMERDLMRTYASGYGETLIKAKLPAAMPFIFNALKVNSTLALIGAIVAEFFGTPILGMGFRISTEVGRMNIAMVWATIAVAAIAGSVSYGLLALAERKVTFWHPSFRQP